MIDALWQQAIAQTWQEWLAVALAVAYVLLAARQNIWCWPAALVSTAIYTWLFWDVALFFQSALNFYYLLMAVYGWLHWKKLQHEQPEKVGTWTIKRHVAVISSILLVTAVVYASTVWLFATEVMLLDVLVAIGSAFVTFLMARKVLENWLYWIVLNSMAAYLYLSAGLMPTGVLFAFYVVFAAYGYFKWRKFANPDLPDVRPA